MTNLASLTKEEQERMARSFCKEDNKDWEKLTDLERHEYMVEASFSVSWLCE